MATWAAFERADPDLAAFGRDRLEGHVCFHATLRPDGRPRVHPVEPWIAEGLLLVRFRARSPKVGEVARDPRSALHGPMDNPEGEGGEFFVAGVMKPVGADDPAAVEIARATDAPLAFYELTVLEAVATTYEGAEREPVYRRWEAAAT